VKFRICPDGKQNNPTRNQPEPANQPFKKISLIIINNLKFLYFADRKRKEVIFSCTAHPKHDDFFNLYPPILKNWRLVNKDCEVGRTQLLDD